MIQNIIGINDLYVIYDQKSGVIYDFFHTSQNAFEWIQKQTDYRGKYLIRHYIVSQ